MTQHRIVPIEPTNEMVEAAYRELMTATMVNRSSIYVALHKAISASPKLTVNVILYEVLTATPKGNIHET